MNDGQATAEMPRYRSHKEVWALEIKAVDYTPEAGPLITPADEGYAPFTAKNEIFARYYPNPGDFYVVYADGYTSISPRKAFLEGYTKI